VVHKLTIWLGDLRCRESMSLEMRATVLHAPAFCQFAQSTARFVQDALQLALKCEIIPATISS
jgi:hypothetical protein